MNLNAASFIAGVGSVVVVLSNGFAGGYFLASPTHVNPTNRLQRLAAENRTATAIPAPTAKPEIVATATPAAVPVSPAVTPAPAAATVAATTPAPADVEAPEPVGTANAPETPVPVVADKATDKDADKNSTPKPGADADNQHPSEARFVERKRSDSKRIAEQQRKQRELEVATVAVRRIIQDRDAADVIIRDRGRTDMVENDPPERPPRRGRALICSVSDTGSFTDSR